jgi:hypothetical protein
MVLTNLAVRVQGSLSSFFFWTVRSWIRLESIGIALSTYIHHQAVRFSNGNPRIEGLNTKASQYIEGLDCAKSCVIGHE